MRAQAAFELLTTYSWVIASVITIASLLIYLNYTDPADFLEEDCQIDGEFSCLDYGLYETNVNSSLYLVLRNRNYEAITEKSVVAAYFKDDMINKTNISRAVKPGEVFEVYVEGNKQGWKSGQKKKINFKIIYYTNISTPGVPKVASGHVYAEIK